jgi:hypothetical protein
MLDSLQTVPEPTLKTGTSWACRPAHPRGEDRQLVVASIRVTRRDHPEDPVESRWHCRWSRGFS